MLRTTRDNKLIGVRRGELYGITYLVTPETTRGADHHRIVLARLYSPKGHWVTSIHRDELIEYPIVEHQQHRLVVGIILNTKETLAGVVGLHIVHIGRRYQLLILLAIGRKGYTTMEEHLDIGPHLLQVLLASHLHHTGQHGEHPRGHTRDICHVLIHRLTGYPFALYLEVGKQGRLLLRHTNKIHQWVDILDEDST